MSEVKSYRRADGTIVRGYKRKPKPGKKKDPVRDTVRKAAETASWARAGVSGVSWRDQLESFRWSEKDGESHTPAALVLKLDAKIFSASERKRLNDLVDRTVKRDAGGQFTNHAEVMAAVNKEAAKIVRKKKKGSTIRPVGPPRKLTASRGADSADAPTVSSTLNSPTEDDMTLEQILAALQAYIDATPDINAVSVDEIATSRAEALDLLRQFDAYRSQPEGVEITSDLTTAALAVRAAYDILGEREVAEAEADAALADAVDAVFAGLDEIEEPDVAEDAEPVVEDDTQAEDDAADPVVEGELVTASRTIGYRRPAVAGSQPVEEAVMDTDTPAAEAPAFLVASADAGLTPHARGRVTGGGAFEGHPAEGRLALAEAIGFVAGEALTAGKSPSFRGQSPYKGFEVARFPGQGSIGTIAPGLDADGVARVVEQALAGDAEHLTAGAGNEPTPYTYGFAGTNVAVRTPVWDSRPRFDTTRSKFGIRLRRSIMDVEPADITDIPDGAGEWTLADDNDDQAVKAEPTTPGVPTTEEYEIEALYRSFELTNLEVLTDPERLDMELRLIGAAWTRWFERRTLDKLQTLPGANYIEVSAGDYGPRGTTREVVPILREMIEELEHQEAFDAPLGYELITLDWARTAVANDLWRRNTEAYDQQSGPVERYLTDDLNIRTVFSSVGASGASSGVSWTERPKLDGGSFAPGAPGTVTWGAHQRTPSTMNYILAPVGTLMAVDRGFLQLGIAPWGDGTGQILRDSTLVYKNKFRVFYELVMALFSTGMPYIVGRITDLNDDGAGVGIWDPQAPVGS